MMGADANQDEISRRVQTEIDRALQRNIKGLEFLTLPKQPVGAMPKDTLLRRGTLQFYHYRPVVNDVYRIPIVFVSPTSNRGYVFDLARGQSLVEFLLMRGYDVFMIDWLAPLVLDADVRQPRKGGGLPRAASVTTHVHR